MSNATYRSNCQESQLCLITKMASVENNGDYEKIKSEASNAISKAIQSISQSSSTKQLAVGTVSGWGTGYITMKIGKTAAFAVGGGIILLQIAQHKGYIKIDWEKIKRNADKAAQRVESNVVYNSPNWMNQIKQFAFANSCFAAGFVGGFLIGMAT